MIKAWYSAFSLTLIPGLLLSLTACPASEQARSEPSASPVTTSITEQTLSKALPPKLMVMVARQTSPGILEMVAEYDSQTQTFASPTLKETGSEEQLKSREKALFDKYQPLNQNNPLYKNGREIGLFTNQEIDPHGCEDYPKMTGLFKTELPVKTDQVLEALAFFPELALNPPSPPLYEDSRALTAIGESLGNAFLKKENLSLKEMRDLTIQALPISQPDGTYKMHIFVTAERPPVGDGFCNNGSFWVLGTWEADQPQILVGKYKAAGEFLHESCNRQEFISSFGFRDHLDHVLIRNNSYEWWDYSIYAPGENNHWSEIYKGGGGGC